MDYLEGFIDRTLRQVGINGITPYRNWIRIMQGWTREIHLPWGGSNLYIGTGDINNPNKNYNGPRNTAGVGQIDSSWYIYPPFGDHGTPFSDMRNAWSSVNQDKNNRWMTGGPEHVADIANKGQRVVQKALIDQLKSGPNHESLSAAERERIQELAELYKDKTPELAMLGAIKYGGVEQAKNIISNPEYEFAFYKESKHRSNDTLVTDLTNPELLAAANQIISDIYTAKKETTTLFNRLAKEAHNEWLIFNDNPDKATRDDIKELSERIQYSRQANKLMYEARESKYFSTDNSAYQNLGNRRSWLSSYSFPKHLKNLETQIGYANQSQFTLDKIKEYKLDTNDNKDYINFNKNLKSGDLTNVSFEEGIKNLNDQIVKYKTATDVVNKAKELDVVPSTNKNYQLFTKKLTSAVLMSDSEFNEKLGELSKTLRTFQTVQEQQKKNSPRQQETSLTTLAKGIRGLKIGGIGTPAPSMLKSVFQSRRNEVYDRLNVT